MSFTLVTACREALSQVVATRLIRAQEEEDRKAKAYEEVSPPETRATSEARGEGEGPVRAEWREEQGASLSGA